MPGDPPWVAGLHCPGRGLLAGFYVKGELLIVLASLPLSSLADVALDGPSSFWGLGSIWQKHLSLDFALYLPLGPWLLLTLWSFSTLRESLWSLVEFALAFIGWVPDGVHGLVPWFLLCFLWEEEWGLDLYFLFDGLLVFIGPVVVRLLVKGVPPAMRGGHGIEVGLPGVGRFVELVYHIIIKLLELDGHSSLVIRLTIHRYICFNCRCLRNAKQ